MKVYIKNKIFSLGGGSKVLDEYGNPVYVVKGKAFSVRHKKTIKDMQGRTLYKVRNKFWNFFVHNAYVFDAEGNKLARVKDKMFNFNHEFFVMGYKHEIKVDGQFFSFTSQILRDGQVIGTIRRQITFIADSFELEADEADIPFLIALVIAIDNITDSKGR